MAVCMVYVYDGKISAFSFIWVCYCLLEKLCYPMFSQYSYLQVRSDFNQYEIVEFIGKYTTAIGVSCIVYTKKQNISLIYPWICNWWTPIFRINPMRNLLHFQINLQETIIVFILIYSYRTCFSPWKHTNYKKKTAKDGIKGQKKKHWPQTLEFPVISTKPIFLLHYCS